MTTKKLRTDADSTIPGLRVVGFHGRLGPDQTPARRSPVYADSKDHLVTVLEASPLTGHGFTLAVEVAPGAIPEDTWTRTGTRVEPPWPARLGDLVVIVGEREVRQAHRLAESAPDNQPQGLVDFLRWLPTRAARSEQLRCARIGDVVAWYCTPEQAGALFERIAEIARQQVIEFAHSGKLPRLKSASLWLSRAAVDDFDIYLAVAGLRLASYRHWEALLEAGIRTGSMAKRLNAVEEAAGQLTPPTAVSSNHSSARFSSSRCQTARRAVLSSVKDLRAATQRAAQRAA